ncbi:TonB-dependent receptor [Luteimonas sp. S4-F44]|uniref:TonB-dependent receptor n=1 Tax=Luteimonas sp. S4-F44 TaxID=2925842 RepID=UPI001F535087|nr:carboxypeptidase regulatory-like domain-containing protein [Luteimonas sp. S4-F44]UNK42897.1 TonB-dependent receptor [Luteimonas sp. S4-F44]
MTQHHTRARRRSALPPTLLAAALGLVLLGSEAAAQSNATGNILGTTGTPGDTVTIRNLDTGTVRTLTTDATGRYRAASLPVGRYRVTLERGGEVVATRDDVAVLLGGGADVSFAASAAVDLDRVRVIGIAGPTIDVSQVDSRTVFTGEDLEKLTVGRDLGALALLAPGAVAGDSRYQGARGFSNVASFGGASASENAYYINGYAVTNPYTALGSTTLPFGGIAQYQAITGGYSAEFGRATGGVVNIVTKSGTNAWTFGGQVVWNPDAGRGDRRNIYYPDGTGVADYEGRLYQDRARYYENEALTYAAYVGGPIVEDRLFFYAAGEFTEQEITALEPDTSTATQTGHRNYDYDIPRWLAKIDWYVNDDHRLELTAISDVTKQTDVYHGYRYTTGEIDRSRTSGYYYEDGGELYIGKYTGNLTDNLTLTALYGQQKQDHIVIQSGLNPDPNAVYVSDTRTNVPPEQRFGNSQQPFSTTAWPDQYDKTDGYRLDLEWRLGDHDVRVGLDHQDLEVRRGTASTGPGHSWSYAWAAPGTVLSGGAVAPAGGEYVVRSVTRQGGTFSVEQSAQYIEDRWQVNDRLLLSLGLRNEQFTNYNSQGEAFISQRHQLAPRLGLAWDVHGDSSLKVFANAGRYHLALPNRTAYRQALPSLSTSEYFAFDSIDPVTGVPQGLTPIGRGPFSPNNEYGQAKNPDAVAAKDIKSHYQDELVVGFEKRLGESWNLGTRFVYRDLKSAIEDFCDIRGAVAWAEANGVDPGFTFDAAGNRTGFVPGGIVDNFANCRLFNPGENNTFRAIDADGNVTEVPLSAQALGFEKLKRRYLGLNLFLEGRVGERLSGKLDYTWSHNYGNAEGQLLSDLGQSDVSATQTYDFPELGYNAYGNLPNDRRHYLRAFGHYQLGPQWRVSATLTHASGRPLNKLGRLPADEVDDPYFYDFIYYNGPYYFYVDGEPSPRGSAGTLPWTTQLDLGLTWQPRFAQGRLQVRGDVFNVFDSQTVQNVIEYWEHPSPGTIYNQAHRAVSYQSPRAFRFQVRYDY